MIITTFKELSQYYKAFIEGYIPFMIVKSSGGHGKTYAIEKLRDETGINTLIFSGHATPLSIYLELFKNSSSRVVFDDVDQLLTNKTTTALLKQICELKDEKTIRYSTTAKIGEDIPSYFVSRNKVLLITNKLNQNDANLKALLTRALYIEFCPSNDEILKIMAHFPKGKEEKEVYKFLSSLKDLLPLTFRDYEKLNYLQVAKIDYKKYFLEHNKINTDEYKIFEIKNNIKNKSINKDDAIIQIMNLKGCSKRQAYNILK
jgi:hypothetical protein